MNIGLLIDGQDVPALGSATFTRIDPVTGEEATVAPAARQPDIDRAVKSSATAFAEWSEVGPSERRTILLKAADLLEARIGEFTACGIAETGATAPWIGFNVGLAAKILREVAAATTQIKGEIIPSDKPGTLSMAVREPVGVMVGMAPWNAPVILAVRAFAMPIACGNTVVLKSSEMCPRLHRMLGDVMIEAGLPKGVLNIVSHSAEDAREVVKHLKPVLLELGGKAPLVVLEDADLDGAVNAAIFGAFMNQGQICMSTERIIVDQKIADEFVARFTARASALPSGNPREKVALGAVVAQGTVDRVLELVADAKESGATITTGGTASGTIMPATIVDRVTPAMRLFREESFGPVVCVVRARDDNHAVELANDTEYGLSSAVFSQNIDRALKVARKIDAGICHINGPTVGDEPQMPFGGVKDSGYGRFGGSAGIDSFTNLRWITIEDPKQHYPF